MALAAGQSRVIISADTDFGALLASSRATSPSVILVRALLTQRPAQLAATVVGHIDLMEAELLSGAIAAFGKDTLRVRALPLRRPRWPPDLQRPFGSRHPAHPARDP